MDSVEIIWRTPAGDLCGVTVTAPERADDDRLTLTIGTGLTLRLPRIEAHMLGQALHDAASAPLPSPAYPVIPIHAAPPAALYHEPEEEPCPNLPAA
jgi:hypothetical protein